GAVDRDQSGLCAGTPLHRMLRLGPHGTCARPQHPHAQAGRAEDAAGAVRHDRRQDQRYRHRGNPARARRRGCPALLAGVTGLPVLAGSTQAAGGWTPAVARTASVERGTNAVASLNRAWRRTWPGRATRPERPRHRRYRPRTAFPAAAAWLAR